MTPIKNRQLASARTPTVNGLPVRHAAHGETAQTRFEAASALERSDPARAVELYRGLESGSDSWAQHALYAHGRLEAARGNRTQARTAAGALFESLSKRAKQCGCPFRSRTPEVASDVSCRSSRSSSWASRSCSPRLLRMPPAVASRSCTVIRSFNARSRLHSRHGTSKRCRSMHD